MVTDRRPRIGISSCLLGETVRYDGGHQRDPLLIQTLGLFVKWVPVCPELEAGMGVPREPVRLVRSNGRLRMVGERSRKDWTAAMQRYERRRLAQLGTLDLAGYVLKSESTYQHEHMVASRPCAHAGRCSSRRRMGWSG